MSLSVPCSDARLPISLASSEERKARADIAASFQVIVFLGMFCFTSKISFTLTKDIRAARCSIAFRREVW